MILYQCTRTMNCFASPTDTRSAKVVSGWEKSLTDCKEMIRWRLGNLKSRLTLPKPETGPLPIGGAACRDCRGAPIIECYRIRLKAGEMLSSGASARKPADEKNAKARFELGALRRGPSTLRVN